MPRSDEHSVVVRGLRELNRDLRRAGDEAGPALRTELREIGKFVRSRAAGNVSHRTGRHGDPSLPPLESTLRVSATQRGATVFSDEVYAGVQDLGGRVGHGATLRRTDVSQYLTRAVDGSRAEVEARLDVVLDRIERQIEGR